MLQADPISLATTLGISVDVFSSPYWDVSVQEVCLSHPMNSDVHYWVSPFGNLRINVHLPTPRSLSQAITSFVACNRQGIHHMRLFAWPYNNSASEQAPKPCIYKMLLSTLLHSKKLTECNDTIKTHSLISSIKLFTSSKLLKNITATD